MPTFFDNLDKAKIEITKKLKSAVEKYLPSIKTKIEYVRLDGSPVVELLAFSHQKKADLIIMGRKKGVTGEKISRKANCSVLLVPQNPDTKINNIIIPVDFSHHSALALKVAEQFSRIQKNCRAYALNVFYVPSYPLDLGSSHQHFSANIKKKNEEQMSKLIKNNYHRKNIQKVFCFNKAGDVPSEIAKLNKVKKGNLIVIGSRGKTAAAALVIGGNTEKLIRKVRRTPILIIKKRNENLGLTKLLFP
jgi:nucleotide-binding universal stress UspA family protein